MDDLSSLRETIELVAQSWPEVVSGDPNTIDVYWHAGKVAIFLRSKLPIQLLSKETGITLVESVERIFIKGSLIRQLTPQSLAERGIELVKYIQENGVLFFEPCKCYVMSLYTWHGCLNMAKLLRKTYVIPGGEAPYTFDMRLEGYRFLQQCWRAEDSKGNPWVQYGVSLAKLLVQKRGNIIVEDWVPTCSPYWH